MNYKRIINTYRSAIIKNLICIVIMSVLSGLISCSKETETDRENRKLKEEIKPAPLKLSHS